MSEKKPVIYTVCTIENLSERPLLYTSKELKEGTKTFTVKEVYENRRKLQGSRTPGYFFKIEDAIKYVELNSMDIYEGCYKHVVIEAMREGFYPIPEHIDGDQEEVWFEWKGSWDDGGYKRIEKPESTKCTCNWGLG